MQKLNTFILSCLIIVVALLAASTITSSLYAISGTLKQQILPQNCIFQTVNDGTGTLFYVTPALCGVIIPPVTPNPPITSPGFTPRIFTPPTQKTTPTRSTGSNAVLNFGYPWQPIANSTAEPSESNHVTNKSSPIPIPPPTAGVLITAALAILIIILIL